jgi:hypothetical protein
VLHDRLDKIHVQTGFILSVNEASEGWAGELSLHKYLVAGFTVL